MERRFYSLSLIDLTGGLRVGRSEILLCLLAFSLGGKRYTWKWKG
jgi:hypothetical protein